MPTAMSTPRHVPNGAAWEERTRPGVGVSAAKGSCHAASHPPPPPREAPGTGETEAQPGDGQRCQKGCAIPFHKSLSQHAH